MSSRDPDLAALAGEFARQCRQVGVAAAHIHACAGAGENLSSLSSRGRARIAGGPLDPRPGVPDRIVRRPTTAVP